MGGSGLLGRDFICSPDTKHRWRGTLSWKPLSNYLRAIDPALIGSHARPGRVDISLYRWLASSFLPTAHNQEFRLFFSLHTWRQSVSLEIKWTGEMMDDDKVGLSWNKERKRQSLWNTRSHRRQEAPSESIWFGSTLELSGQQHWNAANWSCTTFRALHLVL